jgi:hypothetical protein
MRETMAAFFSTQLDFILFFYGLAFLLLGTTCFSISKDGRADFACGADGPDLSVRQRTRVVRRGSNGQASKTPGVGS